MIILIVTIAIGIGIIALVSMKLKENGKKAYKDYMFDMHYQGEKQQDVKDWVSQKEVISSDKIKQLKERELEKKAREMEHKAQHNNRVAEKVTNTVLETEESARAGDVQRNGKEQFNLRKDEEKSLESAEGNWWIK